MVPYGFIYGLSTQLTTTNGSNDIATGIKHVIKQFHMALIAFI
jgi:hypothetical protein